MLPDWAISLLRCPETGQKLELRGGALVRKDGKVFPCPGGIASLVYPETLQDTDASWNRFYDALAPFYDFSERVLGRLLTGVDMVKGRAEIAALAGLEPGSQVLEVSPGPGVFHPLLRKALGHSSRIASADLSLNMLRECRRRHGDLDIALIQANAQHLPFADEILRRAFPFWRRQSFQRSRPSAQRIRPRGSQGRPDRLGRRAYERAVFAPNRAARPSAPESRLPENAAGTAFQHRCACPA